MQRPTSRVVEKLHSAIIADQPIIVPRPLELGLERFYRPAQLLVTVLFDPFGHPLYCGPPLCPKRSVLVLSAATSSPNLASRSFSPFSKASASCRYSKHATKSSA